MWELLVSQWFERTAWLLKIRMVAIIFLKEGTCYLLRLGEVEHLALKASSYNAWNMHAVTLQVYRSMLSFLGVLVLVPMLSDLSELVCRFANTSIT